MASTNGLQNNALVVNTIDGLTTLYATSIYDNGQAVDPGSYVPYTGALFNVDLNNNQLNDVNSLQVNSSIAAASLTTTGLITTNTLKINSVPSGTQTNLLAVDSSGNVIQGASSPPTQIQINAGLKTGAPYYLTFVPSNTGLAKNESLYTEAYYNGYEIQYSPTTQTLSVLNMDIEGQVKIPNLGSSASPSYYVAIDATNQMVKVSAVSAQPNITQVSASGTYYPVFVNSNSAQSGATIYVDPNTSPLSYTITGQTLLCKNLTVSGTTTISGYLPLTGGSMSGAIVFNSGVSPIIQMTNGKFVSYNYTITDSGAAGTTTWMTFTTPAPLASPAIPPLLTIGQNTAITGTLTATSPAFTGTPTAPTAASGTNTTQLATTAFVTTALQNYIPLQGNIAGLNLNAYLGGSTSKFNIYSSTSTLLLGIQQATSPYVSADSLAVTNSFTVGGASVITSTGTTTGVNNIIKLAGTSAQFIIQSSTGGALLSVRQSATPYVGIDSLNVTNALAVGTTSTFTGAITASSDLTVIGTHYGVSYAGSLLANMVFNSPGGGRNIIFQYAGTPILTLNASGGSAVFYNGFVYADAGAGALILGVNGSPASNLALTASSSTFNAPILSANTSGYGQITLCQNTSTGYGVIERNDGSSMYWLVTNVNNPTGSWNSYRPLSFNMSSGQLRSENSQVFLGGTYVDTLNFNAGGQIGSNSGTTYGSFSATASKNGWYGMSMSNNRHYAMSDGSTFGLYDQAYNWLVRGNNGTLYFDSIPYQNYNPGYILLGSSGNGIQYGQMNLTNYYYTGAWGGGVSLGSISKGQTNSVFWLTGMSSYYVSTAGNVYVIIRLYNTSSGIYYYYNNATMFTNVTYNHVSYPINLGIYSLPAGTYNIYVYLNGYYVTDGNDYIYLSFRVTP